MKRTISIKKLSFLLISSLLLSLTACGVKEAETAQEEKNIQEEMILQEEPAPVIAPEDLPVMDGALACVPYYEELAAILLNMEIDEARTHVVFNNTPEGYKALAEGKTDLFFGVRPSEEQEAYAAECGTSFEYTVFANDAFVFFVNKDNPVDSLTMEQLRGIYSGEITNWKEVGGNDEDIIAYQRNESSGSQSGIYRYLISKEEIMEAPTECRIADMGGIIDAVSAYDNSDAAIGYSYLYFVTNQHFDEDIKLLAIDGVYPDEANISGGTYPMVSDYIIASRTGEIQASETMTAIVDWVLSGGGQALAEKLSYVPTDGNEIPRVETIETALHETTTRLQDSDIPWEYAEDSEETDVYAVFMEITELADETVKDSVNRQISEKFLELKNRTDYPSYRGIELLLETYDGNRETNGCYAFPQFNRSNLLSVLFEISFTQSDQNRENSFYISMSEGLTFDMNTGETLKITDLFDDPETGLLYLNGKVKEAIERGDSESESYYGDEDYSSRTLKVIGAFPGLTEDQKYYISTQGELVLIFDYDTPWVWTDGTCPVYLYLDVLDGVDYTQFETEKSLVNGEDATYVLACNPYPDRYFIGTGEYEYGYKGYENASWNLTEEYYANMPAAQQDAARLSDKEVSEFESSAFGLYERLSAAHPDRTLFLDLAFSSTTSRYGIYTNISRCFSYNIYPSYADGSEEDIQAYENRITCLVYKGSEETPLSLEDIFVPEADMDELLKAAAKTSLSLNILEKRKSAENEENTEDNTEENTEEKNGGESAGTEAETQSGTEAGTDESALLPPWFDEYLETVFSLNYSFQLYDEGLYLSYDGSPYTIAQRYLTEQPVDGLTAEMDAWIFSTAVGTFLYKNLGEENLLIFR